jgi:hypothetical protein
MTPSRPAPSKRLNQSAATARSGAKRRAAKIAIPHAEQIPEDHRRGRLLRQELHARSRRVDPLLEEIEVEAMTAGHDDLTVQDAALG